MDFKSHLTSTQMLDCTGQVTHTLTLLPDGMVEVAMPSVTVTVDPTTKTVLRPPGVRIADQVLDQAAILAREALHL